MFKSQFIKRRPENVGDFSFCAGKSTLTSKCFKYTNDQDKKVSNDRILNLKPTLESSCRHQNLSVMSFITITIIVIITISSLMVMPTSAVSTFGSSLAVPTDQLVPCEDVFRGSAHKLPCLCSRDTDGAGSVINCDQVSFFGDFPALPFRQNIVGFTQRLAGIQNLEPQLFTASNIPLKSVDFSHNLLRRLMERLLDGVEGTLQELRLGHNRLGDQLNPIFSTNEFLHLKALTFLDLSYNELRALDSNLFRGLRNLTVSFFSIVYECCLFVV